MAGSCKTNWIVIAIIAVLILLVFHNIKQGNERFKAIGPLLQDQNQRVKNASMNIHENFDAFGPMLKDQTMRNKEKMMEFRAALDSRNTKYAQAASMVEHMRVSPNEDPRENQFMDKLFGTEDMPPIASGVKNLPVFGTLLGPTNA